MKHKYLQDVATLQFTVESCVGCGNCLAVCPHRVWGMEDGRARIKDKDACIECGACALNCPAAAITVKPGVGCAAAIIRGRITGSEPSCDCGSGGDCC